MNREFVPYTESLALRKLGFEEECLAFHAKYGLHFNLNRDTTGNFATFRASLKSKWTGAPLYQQAFRWFREKYEVEGTCGINKRLPGVVVSTYGFTIKGLAPDRLNNYVAVGANYKSHEEAELSCLQKLIELCKRN